MYLLIHWEFYVFGYIFPLLQLILDSPTHPLNFILFFSLKSKTRKKMVSDFYLPLSMKAVLEHDWNIQCHSIEENCFSSFQQIPVTDTFLSRDQLPSYASCHNLCEFLMCFCPVVSWRQWFPDYSLSLAIIIVLPPFCKDPLNLKRGVR